jgi:threonine aldolase
MKLPAFGCQLKQSYVSRSAIFRSSLVTPPITGDRQRAFQFRNVFPVFNGTGANVLALKALTRSHQAVICAEGAHIQVTSASAWWTDACCQRPKARQNRGRRS